VSWDRAFDDPVPGCATLRDAAEFVLRLPKAEQARPHWQTAAEAVIMAAEDRGPTMHARIGMLRAMNFGNPRPEVVRRKAVRKYRIVR
jgi:hypothetical protein